MFQPVASSPFASRYPTHKKFRLFFTEFFSRLRIINNTKCLVFCKIYWILIMWWIEYFNAHRGEYIWKVKKAYINKHLHCVHCAVKISLCSENTKSMQHWLNVGSVLQPCCWLLYWTLTWAPSGAAFKCNILASHHLLLPGVYIFSYRGSTLPRSFLPVQKYRNQGFLELLH